MTSPDDEMVEPIFRSQVSATVFCALVLSGLIAIFIIADIAPRRPPPSSEVRIRNNTEHAFHRVVVNGQLYGNIDPGESSEYRNLRPAYRYASVSLIAGSHEMHLAPEDYVGEVPLGSGKFTYVLRIMEADRMDLSLEKEPR